MPEVTSNKKKRSKEKEMSFWEHLEELRWHTVRSFIAVFLMAILAFIFKGIIFDNIILAPKDSNFITYRMLCKAADFLNTPGLCMDEISLKIKNIVVSGQFMIHLYISFVVGIIVAFPYVIFEAWSFVRPALHYNEKKHSAGAVIYSSILFIFGILFSYFIIVPLTVNFFGGYHISGAVENEFTLSSYISTVVSVTLSVGLVFELPILVYFLTKVGIITPQFMKRNRKYMLVILLTLSAIITPPDVFSQILVCIPLLGLYELSIVIAKRVYKKRKVEMDT